jgi:hypothetical protein
LADAHRGVRDGEYARLVIRAVACIIRICTRSLCRQRVETASVGTRGAAKGRATHRRFASRQVAVAKAASLPAGIVLRFVFLSF